MGNIQTEPMRSPCKQMMESVYDYKCFNTREHESTLSETGTEAFVHGDLVVPRFARPGDWPGIRPKGQLSEYQLIVGAEP
eukprot:5816502-Amphidinium_carterae.1